MPTKVSQAVLKVRAEGGQQAAQQLGQVGKATQQVGKEQTRLGQASASAGRQFSAQANGLGGLVGAYAGAAANIFAITAAFTALAQAAKFDQVIAGTNALASSIGANGRDIINTVNEITKSQLNLLETAQTVNIGLAAGFNTTQIEQLSDVSLRASKALGRSLTDAFTRVSRGAAKLEPELLDELGIFTRIDPAVKKYADSLGRSVSSLTNFERRQAFANAVIEEGTRKFRDVDVSTNTTAESFEKLAATIVNLGLEFGSLLATGLAPIADFISGNLSNALAGFGVLASVVGSRAVGALASGIESATLAITKFGSVAAAKLNSVSSAFKNATLAVQENNATTQLFVRSNSQAAQALNQKLIALQADIAAGRVKTKADLEAAQATIRSAISENLAARARSSNTITLKNQRIAIQALIQQYKALNVAILASTGASNVAAIAATGLAAGIQKIGLALASVISKLFTFITVISLVQLGLDAVAKAFGFEGFSILESLLGFIKSIFDSFTALSRNVKQFANSYKSELLDVANQTGVFGEEAEASVTKAIEAYNKYIKTLEGGSFERGVAEVLGLAPDINNLLDSDDITDVAAGRVLSTLRDEIDKLGLTSQFAFKEVVFGLNAVAEAAGLSTRQVREVFTSQKVISGVAATINKEVGNLEVSIGDLSVAFQRVNENNILVFKEGFLNIAATVTSAADAITDFNTGLAKGTLDAEKAAQEVSAITAAISSLTTQSERNERLLATLRAKLALEEDTKLREKIQLRIDELSEAQNLIPILQRRLNIEENIAAAQAGQLAELEKTGKLLDKIYGKTGEKLEALTLQGALTAPNATFARSPREKELNAVLQLNKLVREGQTAEKRFKLLLDDRAAASRRIRDLNKEINESFKGQALSGLALERAQARREYLSEQVAIQEEKIEQINARIKDQDSASFESIKNKKTALEALALEYENIVKLAGEILKAEKDARAVQLENFALTKKEEELIDRKALQNTKTLLTLEQQRLANQKAFREATGTLIGKDALGFDISSGALKIAVAEEDKKFAIAQAKRENEIALAKIKADKDNFEADAKLRKINNEATIKLIDALQRNALAIENTLREQQGLDPLAALPGGTDITDLSKRAADAFKTIEETTTNNFTLQESIANKELDLKTTTAEDSFNITKDALDKELALKIFNANETVRLAKSVDEAVSGGLSTAINNLSEAVVEGTFSMQTLKDTFRQFFFDVLNSIREAVLEQTLIEPLSDAIANNISKVFGLEDIANQSMEQAAALNTQAAAATASATIATSLTTVGTTLTTSATTLGTQIAASIIPVQTALTSVGTQISLAINTMATQLQIAATTAVARINVAVATASASSSFVPFAAGGSVKKYAAGGSNNLRDRIAALLEPGEFIVRKEAAKKIGLSKLQEMNSGNANIFEMLGMNPVKKAAGGMGMGGGADSSQANFGGPVGGSKSGGFGEGGGSLARENAIMYANSPLSTYGGVYSSYTEAEKEAMDPFGFKAAGESYKEMTKYGPPPPGPKAASQPIYSSSWSAAKSFSMPGLSLFGGMLTPDVKGLFGDDPYFGLNFKKKFASGGLVRDRVPALLEPGEFVMRRPAAMALGGPVLNQMNATGKPPQISVNMTNQGAPKDVQVGTPKMNGDKIILDIITRDLRNNGAIKKTLRKGK